MICWFVFQVGCVGDKGWRRQGYLMQNFHLLIERLQSIYGTKYKITNYIASQLPSVKPRIQIVSLKSLEDPDFVKKNITSISMFYIPPKDTRKTDPEMARKLGLISIVKPEIQQEAIQTQKSDSQPAKLRDISRYGSREQNSMKMLSTWKVPGAYDSTPNTAAAQFMISLAQEPKKLSEFQENPGKLAKEINGISLLQERYLASGNRAMVRLFPWHQVYHTSSGILEIRCKNAGDKGQVIWKDAPIQNFTFSSSTLTWKADTVNQSSAVLKFTTEDGLPLFIGKLWDNNQSPPDSENIMGGIKNFKSPLSV